ncbi:MAG: response regulator [Deltaproteobacteria bacterium]|nr:response regulator [Deltaproteobacteria bacterium]MBI3078160.1 response regulator [Deltaproteobacteria bacterium]
MTRRLRVLVAEDDTSIQRVTEVILKDLGCEVFVASTGQEALDRARSRPRMVVVEIILPDASGLEICRKIHRMCPRAPILLLSGKGPSLLAQSVESSKEIARGYGASDFLTKPFEIAELRDWFTRWIEEIR